MFLQWLLYKRQKLLKFANKSSPNLRMQNGGGTNFSSLWQGKKGGTNIFQECKGWQRPYTLWLVNVCIDLFILFYSFFSSSCNKLISLLGNFSFDFIRYLYSYVYHEPLDRLENGLCCSDILNLTFWYCCTWHYPFCT